MAGNSLDIYNSKNWDKTQWLTFFQSRLNNMRSARSTAETQWDNADASYTMVSVYNNLGELVVSIPLDKVLIEIYEGRTKGIISYDIKSDGQTNEQELQPAKHALRFFLDGNGERTFWAENKQLKSLKAHYGNGFFFTGMRSEKKFMYKIKDKIQGDTDLLNDNNFEEYIDEKWEFFPKCIHPRDFFIDDNALGQPHVSYANDCIFKEKISLTELHLRYDNIKAIDKEVLKGITYSTDITPKNNKDQSINQEDIILYHYYNSEKQTYMLVANETHLLLKTKMLFDDGKLPFVNIQHYYNPNSFYAEGITTRVAYLKASKSTIFENILSTASMGAGVNLVIGNDEQLTEDWEIGGNKINLWRTTGGAEGVQQVNTTPNLGIFTNILALIDQETAIVTGINPSEQITATSDVLGIVEINEANKAVRTSSVDESYEQGLDSTLTMTLARIKQFAPGLLSEKLTDANGKILKTIFPKISIPDTKITKRKGVLSFTEDLGKNGYFELKPDVVQGVGVKVTTNSTSSTMPLMERKKVNDFIALNMKLFETAQLDPTGKNMEELNKNIRFDQLVEWANDAYQFDQNKLKANTKKDALRHKISNQYEQLQEILKINPTQNENPGQNQEIPVNGGSEQVEHPSGELQQGEPRVETP